MKQSKICVGLVLVSLTSATQSQTLIVDDLHRYFAFDEAVDAEVALDQLGGDPLARNANGTNERDHRIPKPGGEGVVGTAWTYDSGQREFFDEGGPVLSRCAAASFAAWVKPTELKTDRRYTVFSEDQGGGDPLEKDGFVQIVDGGKVSLALVIGGKFTTVVTDSTHFEVGRWSHLAFTYKSQGLENGKVVIYVDGEAVKTLTTGSGIINSVNDLMVGALEDGGAVDLFSGMIDEMGFWERELEPKEIQAIYQAARRGVSLIQVEQPSPDKQD